MNILIDELWNESNAVQRCPYVRRIESGQCQCTSPNIPSGKHNLSCAELQLWCLDGKDRFVKCIFHPDWVE